MLKQTSKEWARSEGGRLGVWINFQDPYVLEVVKRAGFDDIRVDQEYIPYDFSRMEYFIRTANLLDLPIFIRVVRLEDITPYIAFGADGIIVPDCNDPARAREAIDRVKHFPEGARGMNIGSRAVRLTGMSPEEYLAKANSFVSLTIQVEDAHVEDKLDDIIGQDGIDFVSSGRGDISQSLGIPGKTRDPKVLEFEEKIVACGRRHDKDACLLVSTKEEMEALKAKGVNMFTIGTDADLLRKALVDKVAEFR